MLLGFGGATLVGDEKVEQVSQFTLEDARPNHRSYRCVIGYYFQQTGTFSAYTGSTVPWHGYMERGLKNNLLPTGCYIYKTSVHRPTKQSRWVDPALRMSDGKLSESGMATVLRTRSNLVFDHNDTWDRCRPNDNIHCAYSSSSFSSLGCQTVKGGMASDLWGDFRETLKALPKNVRIDYILLTGAEFSAASSLLGAGFSIGDPDSKMRLERLRCGSLGSQVVKLQQHLGIGDDGHFGSGTKKALVTFQKASGFPADGIFSPKMDETLNWQVFSAQPETPVVPTPPQPVAPDTFSSTDGGGEQPPLASIVPGIPPAPPTEVFSRADRIPYRVFTRMFVEGELSDEELAEYFVEVPSSNNSLEPKFEINTDRVEMAEDERGAFLDRVNALANRRRRRKYKRKLRQNPDAIRILAEGDSWFQYPIVLRDIIDHLSDDPRIAVRCYSAAGDVLSNMVERPDFLDAIESERPTWFLLSGGGNDLVDGEGLIALLHRYDPHLSPRDYFKDEYFSLLNDVEQFFREVIELSHAEDPNLKIVCHAYDYAVPNSGKWLGLPMRQLGIENPDLQFQIMRLIVNDMNTVVNRVTEDCQSGPAFYLNLREQIPENGWHDEFHPTSEFYEKLASKYMELIFSNS